jgi:hypothetical protein
LVQRLQALGADLVTTDAKLKADLRKLAHGPAGKLTVSGQSAFHLWL